MLRIFPNPAQSYLKLQRLASQNEDWNLEIFDLTGKLVKEAKIEAEQQSVKIDIRNLSAGMYIYKITNVGEPLLGKFEVVP